MKYTAATYAKAFIAALSDTKAPNEASLVRNFTDILKRTRDIQFQNKIVQALEEAIVRSRGGRYVNIESSRPLNSPQTQQIRAGFTDKDLIKYVINPQLIAGMRIIINSERELDVSMRRKLQKLF